MPIPYKNKTFEYHILKVSEANTNDSQWCLVHYLSAKRLYGRCPGGAAQTALIQLLPMVCSHSSSLSEKHVQGNSKLPRLRLIVGGAITLTSLTLRSLGHLLLRLPTHDLNLGCGIPALLFLIF